MAEFAWVMASEGSKSSVALNLDTVHRIEFSIRRGVSLAEVFLEPQTEESWKVTGDAADELRKQIAGVRE